MGAAAVGRVEAGREAHWGKCACGYDFTAGDTYDANGNLTTKVEAGVTTTLTWNADNRLVGIAKPGYAYSASYDVNGLRVAKTEQGVATGYLLDGASVLAELDGSNAVTRSYLNNPQAIDDILSFTEGSGTYWPLTDALGSITALTDASGAVVRRYTYDPDGARTTSGTGPDIAFGFTGREHDASGYIYARDRYLDPNTGRWLQPDRIGLQDGPNLYQYAHGAPTLFTDPLGNFSVFQFANACPSPDFKWQAEEATMGLFAVMRMNPVVTWYTENGSRGEIELGELAEAAIARAVNEDTNFPVEFADNVGVPEGCGATEFQTIIVDPRYARGSACADPSGTHWLATVLLHEAMHIGWNTSWRHGNSTVGFLKRRFGESRLGLQTLPDHFDTSDIAGMAAEYVIFGTNPGHLLYEIR